jgi:hypothetical protein
MSWQVPAASVFAQAGLQMGVKRERRFALSRTALGAFMRAAVEMKEAGTFDFAREATPYAEINKLMKEESR